jgi:hypothetical protein
MLQKQQYRGEDVSAGFHYDSGYSTEQFVMAETNSGLDAHQQRRFSTKQAADCVHTSMLKVEDLGSPPNKSFWYGNSIKASSHSNTIAIIFTKRIFMQVCWLPDATSFWIWV